jgi:hypothetical protein
MWSQTSHLSNEDLLLWLDGELPRRRAAKAGTHLSACWDCRSRMAQIASTIHDFMHAHHSSVPELPPSAGPRALLKARLAAISMGENEMLHLRQSHASWVWAAACLLVLVTGGLFLHYPTKGLKPDASDDTPSLPNRRLTPGATMAADIGDLCSTRHDEVVRSVPNALQDAVLREYGLPASRAQNFEIDFLISPGLGGAESIRNLWPEPRYGTLWNSFAKDQLEDYLHQSVCAGRVSLQTAQKDIALDWVSAYQKYFRTTKPLTSVSGLSPANQRVLAIFLTFRGPATHEVELPLRSGDRLTRREEETLFKESLRQEAESRCGRRMTRRRLPGTGPDHRRPGLFAPSSAPAETTDPGPRHPADFVNLSIS